MSRKKEKLNGPALVARAIAGMECKAFLVNGKRYVVYPPTIRRLCAAGAHLAGFDAGETIGQLLESISDMGRLAKALSCFIEGDERLAGALMDGTPAEVVGGIEAAYSMVDPQVFMKAVSLARSVARLIATPK